MFRCPYCGEQVFTNMLKMGIHSKFGTAPRCPACHRIVFRETSRGGNNGYYVICMALGLIAVCGLMAAFVTSIPLLFVLSLISFIALYLFFQYYLCHFDVAKKEKSNFSVIKIKTNDSIRLWPHIRQGEIYIIVPEEVTNPQSESKQTIALLEEINQNKHETTFMFRLIRTPDDTRYKLQTKIKIITDKLVINGTIEGMEKTGECDITSIK